jgi:hypothetical protein
MIAEIEVIAGEAQDAVLVPLQSLREMGPDQYSVFVVGAGGELEMRIVEGLWLVDAGGTDEYLLFAWHEACYPSCSPDDQDIVFSRQHRGHVEDFVTCMDGPKGQACRTMPPNPHYNLGVVRVEDGSFYEPLPSTSKRSLTLTGRQMERVLYARMCTGSLSRVQMGSRATN